LSHSEGVTLCIVALPLVGVVSDFTA
jgi:hypothetical protein